MRQQNRRVLCHKGSQRLCELCVLLQKLRFLRRISRHTEDTEFRNPARPNTFCVFSDGLWPFSVFCGRFRPTAFTTMARILPRWHGYRLLLPQWRGYRLRRTLMARIPSAADTDDGRDGDDRNGNCTAEGRCERTRRSASLPAHALFNPGRHCKVNNYCVLIDYL